MGTYSNGSKILNQLGLTGFDVGYAVIATGVLLLLLVIVLVLLILQIVKTGKLKKRLDGFLVGKDGASLEQDIINLFEDNKFLKSSANENKKDIRILYRKLVHSTEGCYSYTKEIKNGECKISLGQEEAEALAIAIGEAEE